MEKPDTKSASAAIVVYNKKILLILRDAVSGIYAPNTWSVPGGLGKEGESSEEILLRELEEEIGIRPKNFNLLELKKSMNTRPHCQRHLGNLYLIQNEFRH